MKVKIYCLFGKFIFSVLLLFPNILCLGQSVEGDGKKSVSESTPENSIVYKIGNPNGKPASPDDPLADGEFSILSGEGNTVQVRKPEQFPQILLPGQRIAIFLPGLEKKHILLETTVVNKWSLKYDQQPLISILFNQKLLHKYLLHKTSNPIRIIIPSSYSEKGGNILEICNGGLIPLAFDYLKLEYYTFPSIVNVTENPTESKMEIPREIRSMMEAVTSLSNMGNEYQVKLFCRITSDITEYFQNKGDFFPIEKLAKKEEFYDRVTGKPRLSFYGLKRCEPLFEGHPSLIPANLFPLADEEKYIDVFWTAMLNSDGVGTAQIAAWTENWKSAKFQMVVPWSGKTICRIISGCIPSNIDENSYEGGEKIKITEKIVDIQDNLFEHTFELTTCTTIRLIREKASLPPPDSKIADKAPFKTPPVFKKGILAISEKRVQPETIMSVLRKHPTVIGIDNSVNYKGSEIYATKGSVGKIRNVSPYDGKSDLIEISYPEKRTMASEGARVYLGPGPENCREFSFWVYPRSVKKEISKVSLQFYFRRENNYHFLSIDLNTDKWQRVVMSADIIRPPYWTDICFVGDPKLPEYANGNKVSFEFNDFCVLGDQHYEKGKSGLKSSRFVNSGDSKKLVFIGLSGSYFEYRMTFKDLVDFKGVKKLPENCNERLVFKKDSQILEIAANFPDKDYNIPEGILNLLLAEEKNLLNEKMMKLFFLDLNVNK